MGVGISLHKLAGAVAASGGMGLISTAQIGFREPDFKTNFVEANLRAIRREMQKAREIAPKGAIGFNIMVATKHYDLWVKEAIKSGADAIVSGAGLPVRLPEYAQAAYEEMKAGIADAKENCEEFCKQAVKKVKLAPIVSSAKSAQVICRLWDRKYKQVPDFVVVEGPLAGGHLGFSREELAEYGADTKDVPNTYNQEAYDKEVRSIMEVVKTYEEKYQKHIPVVTAGGIYTHEDVKHQFELGAEGVQVATRFVTTEECDAPDAYKQAYINSKKRRYRYHPEPGRNARTCHLKSVFTADQRRRPSGHQNLLPVSGTLRYQNHSLLHHKGIGKCSRRRRRQRPSLLRQQRLQSRKD